MNFIKFELNQNTHVQYLPNWQWLRHKLSHNLQIFSFNKYPSRHDNEYWKSAREETNYTTEPASWLFFRKKLEQYGIAYFVYLCGANEHCDFFHAFNTFCTYSWPNQRSTENTHAEQNGCRACQVVNFLGEILNMTYNYYF